MGRPLFFHINSTLAHFLPTKFLVVNGFHVFFEFTHSICFDLLALPGLLVKYRLVVVGGSMAGYSNEINVTALPPA